MDSIQNRAVLPKDDVVSSSHGGTGPLGESLGQTR
jgi:hypothetical protein